ncbi:heterokaryon incompatibility protein-domain-containing protein [Rhypophila decipiens]|uniref:Heterokaryon incompatibility protein-domain-containing protein n=1 Tax=Rhypophila decipiens TaxID=261697 RepID=A0AAN6XSY3_9PEZI|nr:heterokaryon incompatibility protein-domain-containing protein [Rhypophila decipiens]
MTFEYPSAASSDELRLLEPVSITHSSLHFNLIKVPRTASPKYTAVSYTWGDGEASEIIYLNNRQFRVRVNLWSCLHYVGQHAKSIGVRLWVDAICIDQNNTAERNSQVRRMDETYKQAAHVSVWLGLPIIPDFVYAMVPDHMKPVRTYEDNGFTWYDHLEDLANRPYWSRIWVIQEFLLCESIVFFCGNTMMDWIYFRAVLCMGAGITEHEYAFSSFGTPDAGPAVSSAITSFTALPLVMARNSGAYPELARSFYELLVIYHRAECKDPRDKIFGLLGLLAPTERGLLERFFPDYNLSVDHVQIIALAHLLQTNILKTTPEITTESNELFLGLGVKSGAAERRRLLRLAGAEGFSFDYHGEYAPGEAARDLTISEYLDRERFPKGTSRDDYYDNKGAGLFPAIVPDPEAIVPPGFWEAIREIEEGPRRGRRLGFAAGLIPVVAAVALVCWRYGVLRRSGT